MKKEMKIKESLRDFILIIVFIGLLILFSNFILENLVVLGIAFLFFMANYMIIFIHEKKYKENFPYKPYKSKKKISERILIGFLAGVHYTFFIGSYNHKKYNTQVNYPETIECVFGNISQMIIIIIYLVLSVSLFNIIKYYSLFFMAIPIITNIINIAINKKR